jgi:hypothetical protein
MSITATLTPDSMRRGLWVLAQENTVRALQAGSERSVCVVT